MKSRQRKSLLLFVVLFCTAVPVHADDDISFNRDIRPILADKCYFCHGPDDEQRQASLRLDIEDAAKEYVIVAGAADRSELVQRISSADPSTRMPPIDSKLSLTAHEIETIRRWVEQGAPWEEHWAFIPPIKPDFPEVQATTWPANEIDYFVLSRLEREGVDQSTRAKAEQLIRRVTFDLTGLPPTLAEIDAFLADESDAAYEQLVDRLLESERFGEHMAASWLDAARYSDTYGYQVDRDRYVWPWRDWVVRAFNSNLPYDQFITQQLAGDLLPAATSDQILATTFNRLHPQKVEGGSVPEEFRIEYVADRTQTFSTVFMGLTFECARCHDHKFDPLRQREYYQLSAFFDNIDEAGLYSFFTDSVPTPTLLLTEEATQVKLNELNKGIDAQIRVLEEMSASTERQDPVLEFEEVTGRIEHLDFESNVPAPNTSAPGRFGNAAKLTGDDAIVTKVGNFSRWQPFSVSLWLRTPDKKERAVVFHRSRAWTDAGSRGYQLLIEDGRLSASLIHFWPGNAISVRTRDEIRTNEWVHVVMTYDGSSQAQGLRIFVNGSEAEVTTVRDNLYKNITGGGGDTISIGERFRDRGFTDGLVDEFQVFDRRLTSIEVAQLHDGESLRKLLAVDDGTLTAKQQGLLNEYVLSQSAEYVAALAELARLREERCKLQDAIPEIMVMRETEEPRQTYLLTRGAYDARSEPVAAGTPSSLPAFPADQPRNRLGLARWLTAKDHPLTARVAVNRFWQVIFGRGLVSTPEDFGNQGALPSHPDLLDWLATDFVEHGWNVKRLIRQFVTSETYRQSSQASRQATTQDPLHLLLSRAPSYRLPAEMLRDNALAVSGLLVEKIGGPPARPYELEASFKPVGRQKGEGLYRRSLYTYWKRTAPAPAMMTFDAAKRDVCRMRREHTRSPLQALVLLNAPQFVEAARMLAEHSMKARGDHDDEILVDLFRSLTSRHPTEVELDVLGELHTKQLRYFQADPKRAEEYLSVGDAAKDKLLDPARLAAFATVANTLMSFDDCITKQ